MREPTGRLKGGLGKRCLYDPEIKKKKGSVDG